MENKTNVPLIIGAIACSLLLASLDIQKVYAEVTVTVVTPTGGSLGATSDCSDVAKTINYIWVNCNNVLYNLSPTTYAVVGSLAVTMSGSETMLGSISGNTVYISNGGVINKYTWNGTGIQQSGSYSSCGSAGSIINYDSAGYIWFVCSVDQVVRLNPFTMTASFDADLTDGAGIECGSPQRVHYSPLDNIGVVRCGTQNTMATFSIATSTTATMLDSDVGTIANNNLYIYGFLNTIVAMDGSNVESWTYDSGGITTLHTNIVIGNDNCRSEVSDQAESFMICIDDSGTSTAIHGIKTNATNTYEVLNTLQTGFDASAGIGKTYVSGEFSTWYVASSLNNQRIIIISGLRETSSTPEPPDEGGTGGDTDGEGNAIDGVCQNGTALECVGGNTHGIITGGQPLQNTTSELCQGLGVCDPDNDDPQTNGTGIFLMLATGVLFSSILIVSAKKSNYELSSLPKEIWLFLVIGVVGLAFYFHWIPDIIFYGMIIGIAGLFAVGLYTRFTGSNGGS